MHNLYFVVFKNKDGEYNPLLEELKSDKEKENNRLYAHKKLSAEWFCSQNGYGYADWFVIGGRWSGFLTKTLGKTPVRDMDKFNEEMVDLKKRNLKGKELEKELKETNEWICRDTYAPMGYNDDSMIISKELIRGFKGKEESRDNSMIISKELIRGFKKGKEESQDKSDWVKNCEFVEYVGNKKTFRTISSLNKNDIGKVIVVVDYHN